MSAALVLEINRRLRAAGVTVHEWPGCMTRGNGQSWGKLAGGIVHHTGSPYGPGYRALFDGRADLGGPLCGHAGNEDGSLTFMALYPANHAGASGGKSMGPLPVTSLFNKVTLGLEIVYPGTSPMRPAQYRTALIWARVVADVVGGGNIEVIRAHAETSITGKWDPGYARDKTIDMRQFRADAARSTSQEINMALTPDDGNTRWAAPDPTNLSYVETHKVADWLGMAAFYGVHNRTMLLNVHAKLDALGVAVAQIRNKVNSFDPDNDGLVSTEGAAATEDWAAVVEAAERGAREGVTKDVIARIDALEQTLQADDAEQARNGAREALAGLRSALPQLGA